MTSVGPIRIPKEYKEALEYLLVGKPHITISHLVREAIYFYLKNKGLVNYVEQKDT